MKRVCLIMSVVFLSFLLIVPTVMAKKPIRIRFSHVVAENTPKGWAANEYAKSRSL